MKSIVRTISEPNILIPHHLFLRSLTLTQQRRSLVDSTVKWIRDRGLDHAVEKEKNLKPLVNIKNFIKSEPSKSVPISALADNRDALNIPIRPIEFIRKYPSVFEELLPGGLGIHPHIKLTPEVVNLDADEQLIYQSESYKQQSADRLLKLLMLCRVHKIPLNIIESLKWDLGLPNDYVKTIVPEFPDYFRVVSRKSSVSRSEELGDLELVCWSDELATSALEKKAINGKLCNAKGEANMFPTQFSSGFQMEKKYKKWLDEWQKLPYVSPYKNAAHLSSSSDESDKWAVAVLHEVLHILISKKTDKENVLLLGEYLGLRSRFKRALLNHPGIFYVSSKVGTYTVVLREGFKRGLLIENHPLMNMRNQYIHLMHTVKEESKVGKVMGKVAKKESSSTDSKEGFEEEDNGSGEETEMESNETSDTESEGTNNNGSDRRWMRRGRGSILANSNQVDRRKNIDSNRSSRNSRREILSGNQSPKIIKDKLPSEVSSRTEKHGKHNTTERRVNKRSNPQKTLGNQRGGLKIPVQ